MQASAAGPGVPDPDAHLSRHERRWLDLLAACLIALAFARGVSVTHDLDWPNDPDLYRDIAQAQTILDGSLLADPHYLGETIWYHPLVPAIVAGLQWTTGARLHVVETRSGAYLNVLGAVLFYVLTRTLLGRWTAVAATAIYLFCAGDSGPSYASSTYSPWLFVANFVQALFYACALALYSAVQTNRTSHFAVLGILLGLTFLGHAAPAVLTGSLVSLYTAARAVSLARQHHWVEVRRTLARYGVAVVLALLVSAPYLVSIVGHYRLRILNLYPTFWIYPDMEVANLGRFLGERLGRNIVVPALVGLIALLTVRRVQATRTLVLSWMGLALLFLAYSYVWQIQAERDVIWPSIVPGFHFLRYFNAGESILAAYGLVAAGAVLASLATRWQPDARWAAAAARRAVPVLLVALLVRQSYPSYMKRIDFTNYRYQARQMFTDPDHQAIFQWVRQELGPSDVVAAPASLSFSVIGTAGRKVLVVNRFFSNPYVRWEERQNALDALYSSLADGSCDAFRHRADEFHVTHLAAEARSVQPATADACGLSAAFVGQTWVIYRRR